MSRRPVIAIEDVRRTYQLTDDLAVHALDGVSLESRPASCVAIMSSSGSGEVQR